MFAAGVDQHGGPALTVGIVHIWRCRDGWIEARDLATDDLGIPVRLRREGHGPDHRLEGVRIDIGIDGDEILAVRGVKCCRRAKRLPRLAECRAVELNDEHHIAAGHLMAGDLGDRRDVAGVLKMIEINRVEGDLPHHRAFARWELADDALVDWVAAMDYRLDVEDLLHLARAEIAASLTEGSLRL